MVSNKNSKKIRSTSVVHWKTENAPTNVDIEKSSGIMWSSSPDGSYRSDGRLYLLVRASITQKQIEKTLKNGLFVWLSPEQVMKSLRPIVGSSTTSK